MGKFFSTLDKLKIISYQVPDKKNPAPMINRIDFTHKTVDEHMPTIEGPNVKEDMAENDGKKGKKGLGDIEATVKIESLVAPKTNL